MSRSPGLHLAADDVLHLGDVVVADFEPRAAGHAHVDDELAGIGARKVGAAEERKGQPASSSDNAAERSALR